MAHFHNNALIGSGGLGGDTQYQIQRSLRFNKLDNAYLNRTPSSQGSRTTWTWSGWVKRSGNDSDHHLFVGDKASSASLSDTTFGRFYIESGGAIRYSGYTTAYRTTNALLRDQSAWYHIVLAVDTTQSTADDRIKIYLNGSQITSFATKNNPSQGAELAFNQTTPHTIGARSRSGTIAHWLDGYLTEIHFVDGQALAASDFGEYDDNNIWIPKEFQGVYDQKAGGRTIANSSGALPILNTSGDDGDTATSGVRTDANASNIVLALPLNGSNGGTTITDYHHTVKGSGSAKAISIYTGSASGGAVTSTAVSKYYGSSFYAVRGATNNYTASDYIYRTGDSDLDLGTGSFCVEFWYYPTAFQSNCVIFDNRHQSNSWPNSANGFSIVTTGNGSIFTYSGGNQIINHSTKLTLNAWNHIAYTRDGSTERLFVNGDFFSTTASSSRNYNEGRFHLGSAANNGEGSDGYYQDLRIYKGVAKYTSNFTVPVVGTGGVNSFFLKFEDNSSNAALGTDSSGLNNTWTVNNLTAVGVDANTSQTWSSSSSGYHAGAGSAFDGNLTTSSFATGGANANAYVDIGAINASKVEVYISAYGSASAGAYYYCRQTNGTQHTYTISSSGTSLGWITVYDGSQISINRLGGARNSSAAAGSAQYGWRVDGVLLVDSGTAGFGASATDSLIDTPTNFDASSGNNVGNYATLNKLASAKFQGRSLTDGNLNFTGTRPEGHGYPQAFSTFGMTSGKFYCEALVKDSTDTNGVYVGVCDKQMVTTEVAVGSTYPGGPGGSAYGAHGKMEQNNSVISTGNGTYTGNDVIGIAYDADNGKLYFSKNGTFVNSANPAGGTNPNLSGITGEQFFVFGGYGARGLIVNFGQRAFKYTPPSGFSSLCTQNLPDPTIAEGASVFDITLYTGNGSGQTISGLDFSPDWAWIKRRSGSTDHCINDTVRGAGKQLNINQNYAEVTNTNNFAAFTSDGFTVGNGSQTNAANPPETHVAWTWDAGESNTSISAGSLNSTAYNTDRVWSNGIANSNSDFDQAKTNAFNGNHSDMLRSGGNQLLVTLNFSPALTVSNSIEILGEGWPTAAATFVFTVDGSTTTRTTSQGRPATFNVSGSLTRITMQNVSSNGRTYLTYIKVDGKELIDSNITPPNIPSIASTVRANQSAGFSIVSYEGNNTGGATIGHGLNAQPKFIVVKDRDSTSGWWAVYHDGVGAGKGGYLNDGQAFSAQSHWSYSDPSSSVFYVGSNANTNANQNDFIAYCFAPVEGYSAFGSYTGSGNADGPFIYTGFRPRWLMIKSSSNSGEDWLLLDTSRDPSNTGNSTAMYASQRHADNSTNAITTNILSNGFKCIGTNAATNASGYTYIYHAFAEHPFKTARAR